MTPNRLLLFTAKQGNYPTPPSPPPRILRRPKAAVASSFLSGCRDDTVGVSGPANMSLDIPRGLSSRTERQYLILGPKRATRGMERGKGGGGEEGRRVIHNVLQLC